jgi:hypothetical protein
MRKLAAIGLALTTVSLAGCASGPSPALANGNYYWLDKKTCHHYDVVDGRTITCYNKKGESSGNYYALSQEDLQNYAAQKAYESQQIGELTASLNQTSNSFANMTNQMANQTSSWTPPAVMNPAQPKAYDHYTCLQTSTYTAACKQH